MVKSTKFVITIILVAVISMVCVPGTAASILTKISVELNTLTIKLNDKTLTKDNIIYNGNVYVRADTFSDLLGKKLEWDKKSKIVTISNKVIPKTIHTSDLADMANYLVDGERGFYYSPIDFVVRVASGKTLIAVGTDGHIYKSLDWGTNWSVTNIPVTTQPDTVSGAICTSGFFVIAKNAALATIGYFSADGITFTSVLTDFVTPLLGGIASNGDNIVFGEYDTVGTNRKLRKSTNGGQTWAIVYDAATEIRHWHSVDVLANTWIATSGDDGTDVKWYTSTDMTTWTIEKNASSQQAFRTLGIAPLTTEGAGTIPETRIMWAADAGGNLGIFSAELDAMAYVRHHFSLPARAYAVQGSGNEVLIGVLSEDPNEGRLGRIFFTKDGGETLQEDYCWQLKDETRGGVHAITGPDSKGNYYLTLKNVEGYTSTYTGWVASPTGRYKGNIKSYFPKSNNYARQVLFDALALRTKSITTSTIVKMRGSRFKSFTIQNGLDQNVTVIIRGMNITSSPAYSKTLGSLTVNAGTNLTVDCNDVDKNNKSLAALAQPYEKIFLWVVGSVDPTKGTISAWVVNKVSED